MTIKMFLATVGTLALLSTGVAQAQTAATDKPAATATTKKAAGPAHGEIAGMFERGRRKSLHGKERKNS